MSESKRNRKSKLALKDLNISEMLNESQFVKNIPKKRTQKQQQLDDNEDDISSFLHLYQADGNKKKKVSTQAETLDSKYTRQKLLEAMGQQQLSRNELHENFIKNLLDVITQMEADHEVLKENEQKLEHFANVLVKCIKQTSSAQKQNLQILKDIYTLYKKECEQLESTHKCENVKLATELEDDMGKLKQQLIAETKRKQVENLRRTIFHAIHNDL